jgi:hypothetical protein
MSQHDEIPARIYRAYYILPETNFIIIVVIIIHFPHFTAVLLVLETVRIFLLTKQFFLIHCSA